VIVTGLSLLVPLLGVGYLAATGKISFLGTLRALGRREVWTAGAIAAFTGGAISLAANSAAIALAEREFAKKIIKKITAAVAKRVVSFIGFIMSLWGLFQSITATLDLVRADVPPENAELFVAIFIVTIFVAVILGSFSKKWFAKGSQSDKEFWELSAGDKARYELGQSLVSPSFFEKYPGSSLAQVLFRGEQLEKLGHLGRISEGVLGFVSSVKGLTGRFVSDRRQFDLLDWIESGPTPRFRAAMSSTQVYPVIVGVGADFAGDAAVDD
jgi:hypothetical protein